MKNENTQFIFFLFYVVFLTSCNQNTHTENITFQSIKIRDRFTNKLDVECVSKLTVAEFSPLYIGKINKEIKISYQYYETVRKTQSLKQYKFPKYNSLEIFIDTTKIIGVPMGIYEYSKKEKRNNKIAYPIFIKNVSKDTLDVGYAEYLPIIIEAKDKNENWKPIQKKFTFDCGTGILNFYCAPNNIIISSIKKFKGNLKTKLRLKFERENVKIYSNEIDGEINESQFNP